MEIASVRTQNGVLSGWSEDVDMKRLSWDGAKLGDGDMVYFRDRGVIFIVKIRVEKQELYSDELAMSDAEAEAFSAYAASRKAQREAKICSGPDCGTLVDGDGYNAGAME